MEDEKVGFWSMMCDLCGESMRYSWRHAWRPADPEPRHWVALCWSCAPRLCKLEPETWAYSGHPPFKLYCPGFERGDVIELGDEDMLAHLRDEDGFIEIPDDVL